MLKFQEMCSLWLGAIIKHSYWLSECTKLWLEALYYNRVMQYEENVIANRFLKNLTFYYLLLIYQSNHYLSIHASLWYSHLLLCKIDRKMHNIVVEEFLEVFQQNQRNWLDKQIQHKWAFILIFLVKTYFTSSFSLTHIKKLCTYLWLTTKQKHINVINIIYLIRIFANFSNYLIMAKSAFNYN